MGTVASPQIRSSASAVPPSESWTGGISLAWFREFLTKGIPRTLSLAKSRPVASICTDGANKPDLVTAGAVLAFPDRMMFFREYGVPDIVLAVWDSASDR